MLLFFLLNEISNELKKMQIKKKKKKWYVK